MNRQAEAPGAKWTPVKHFLSISHLDWAITLCRTMRRKYPMQERELFMYLFSCSGNMVLSIWHNSTCYTVICLSSVLCCSSHLCSLLSCTRPTSVGSKKLTKEVRRRRKQRWSMLINQESQTNQPSPLHWFSGKLKLFSSYFCCPCPFGFLNPETYFHSGSCFLRPTDIIFDPACRMCLNHSWHFLSRP